MADIISASAIIGIGGIFQLLIGIIFGIIFIVLPKRKKILATLGSIFIGSGILQIVFGMILWRLSLYVN
jgi:hypothetical protein